MQIRTLHHSPQPRPQPSNQPQAPEPHKDSYAPLLGAVAGGIVGGLLGRSGALGVAAAAGLGGASAAASATVPYFRQAIQEGVNGDVLNDVALVCSSTFAGGVLISAGGAGAAALAYPLALALPAGGHPLLAAALGAAAGAFVAR